jgi:hypothetical protein
MLYDKADRPTQHNTASTHTILQGRSILQTVERAVLMQSKKHAPQICNNPPTSSKDVTGTTFIIPEQVADDPKLAEFICDARKAGWDVLICYLADVSSVPRGVVVFTGGDNPVHLPSLATVRQFILTNADKEPPSPEN